jgi:hypothetical protein
MQRNFEKIDLLTILMPVIVIKNILWLLKLLML